jgi:ABC-type nitrate/sulfonate/bicarbonate transport system ATPase subunit
MGFAHERKEVLLQIRDVNLRFGETVVLSNVNASVHNVERPGCTQGQVVGLLGPSGIGKTQLFRIIAGLNIPTSGKVLIGESGIPVSPGLVGVVAQNYPLFNHRTVLSNMMVAAGQKYTNKSEAEAKVHELLVQFGLEERKKLYPKQLSGGQKQRAAIIQQMLCSENFLLMDEPFSGLDLIMLEKVANLINQVALMDEKNTIIVITHDVTAACSVSDTLWLMGREHDENGKIIPGARIVQEYDLIERELCWNPSILSSTRFLEFTREVKERFRTL